MFLVDVSAVEFIFERARTKFGGNGEPSLDKTGRPEWDVFLMSVTEFGLQRLRFRVAAAAGSFDGFAVGDRVEPVEVSLVPWEKNGFTNFSLRAKGLRPVASAVRADAK